jgi:hypothetical protein
MLTARSLPSGISNLIEFEKAYEAWRLRPFPKGSHVDALDELHADLALADTWVAESVVPFIKRGVYSPAQVDVMEILSEVRSRATKLAESVGGADREVAMEYAAYAHLLEIVYEAFLRRPHLRAPGPVP